MPPEDDPRDDEQPTEAEYEEYLRRQVWRCKVCRRVAPRSEWGTYRGSLACSSCLTKAYVDTLEPVEPARG